jgi:hypothetical protein
MEIWFELKSEGIQPETKVKLVNTIFCINEQNKCLLQIWSAKNSYEKFLFYFSVNRQVIFCYWNWKFANMQPKEHRIRF